MCDDSSGRKAENLQSSDKEIMAHVYSASMHVRVLTDENETEEHNVRIISQSTPSCQEMTSSESFTGKRRHTFSENDSPIHGFLAGTRSPPHGIALRGI